MFVTFEGINGSGKSTQAKILFDFLKKQGKDVIITKEPGGGGEFCLQLRRLLCQTKNISKMAEMFVLFASRKEHLDKVILPALDSGKIVICDRYIDSTFAYQCCEDESNIDFVKICHKKIGGLMPDKTIFIDISVKESEYRLAPLIYSQIDSGSNGYKKYDELETEHMQKILNMYRKIASENKDRIISIDGTREIEEIHRDIVKSLGF